jgi:RNA polymerase primary sigma factor
MTKDYRVEIKIRNNLLLEKIERAGYKNVAEFAKAISIPYSVISNFITMKKAPINKFTNTYSPRFMEIVDFLDCMPEDIFPKNRMSAPLKSNYISFKGDEGDVKNLTASMASIAIDPEKKMIVDEAQKTIHESLYALTPKEHRVLTLLFGLDGSEPKTLEQLGKEFNVSRERIRQVQREAFRKLKHPAKSKKLREIYDDFLKDATQN